MSSMTFLVLLQLLYLAGRINAISLEEMIFRAPAVDGKPPSIPLNFNGGVPTVDFSLGTPLQNFTGVFDTGSPITWVISSKCKDTGCENVPQSQKFDSSKSSTNQPFPTEIEISYLDGTHVHLQPELDTVTLAGKYPFPRHLVGEALQVGYPAGFLPAANARIGVGDYSNKVLDPNPSKLTHGKGYNAPVGGGLARRAAGDAHTSTGPATSGSPGFRKRGIPTTDFRWVLGDDPSMYKGPLYPLALVSAADTESSPFWKVPLKGLSVYGQSYQISGFGTVSSSTPYIMAPPTIADAINKAIGATYHPETRMYTIPCSAQKQLPPLVIQFLQGLNAELPASQYINEYEHAPQGQSDACFSTIVNGPDDQTVYLGGPFFRSYYLGFAVMEQTLYVAQSVVNTGATLSSGNIVAKDGESPNSVPNAPQNSQPNVGSTPSAPNTAPVSNSGTPNTIPNAGANTGDGSPVAAGDAAPNAGTNTPAPGEGGGLKAGDTAPAAGGAVPSAGSNTPAPSEGGGLGTGNTTPAAGGAVPNAGVDNSNPQAGAPNTVEQPSLLGGLTN